MGAFTTVAGQSLILQSTTSTANSGLYDYLLPKFKQATGIDINVVAVGTGQAIKNAQNCDGDVLLVHAKSAEESFIAEGYGVERFDVMYNDFIFIGPPADPAGIRSQQNVIDGLQKIAGSRSFFLSRGDNSGTHKKELSLWAAAGIDPLPFNGDWYRETGSGMGATLNVTVEMNAYTMADRGTWISFGN
ncbi:MAG: substrate-binding domain-containing protein, partial [Gammaproteobacteria bacterium]|nr:substrate-binding domain-containing protein [Gammaproteobacteria bacterium]